MTELEKAIEQAMASPGLVRELNAAWALPELRDEIRAALANVAQAAQAAQEIELARTVRAIRDAQDHGPDVMTADEIADRLEGGSL